MGDGLRIERAGAGAGIGGYAGGVGSCLRRNDGWAQDDGERCGFLPAQERRVGGAQE